MTKAYLGAWAIYGLLCSSDSMDGAHQSFFDSKVVINDLCNWSKAIGGARSITEIVVMQNIRHSID